MNVRLIVATSSRGIIGNGNDIPWKLKDDMKFFKETTTGGVVIMGRKTFESMGLKPLPKRYNIIITRDPAKLSLSYDVKKIDADISIVSSLHEALVEAELYVAGQHVYPEPVPRFTKSVNIIGGAEIYKQAMESGHVDEVIITNVLDNGLIEGDIIFNPYEYMERIHCKLTVGPIVPKDKNNEYPFVVHHYTHK